MKNLTLYLVIVLIFSSCSANYHVKKAKQKCPECFISDTTINSIIFKLDTVVKLDTFIWVKLPNDTVKIDSIVFKAIKPSFDKIIKKNGIITTEISMTRGELNSVSYLDSSFYYRLQDSIRIKNAKIYELKEVIVNKDIVIKEEKSLKEWFKIALFSVLGMFIIGLAIKFIIWVKK